MYFILIFLWSWLMCGINPQVTYDQRNLGLSSLVNCSTIPGDTERALFDGNSITVITAGSSVQNGGLWPLHSQHIVISFHQLVILTSYLSIIQPAG